MVEGEGRLKMEIRSIQNEVSTYFADKPVKKIYLFGSALKDTSATNDIDLIADFDFEEAPSFDLFDHIGYCQELEEILNKKVDILTYSALKPSFINAIGDDIMKLYERQDKEHSQLLE